VKKEDGSGTTIYVGSHYERFSPQEMVIGEAGYLNDTLTHTPQTVYLSRHYVNPVVFTQPVSRDGRDTSVVRITDVQADRFTLYLHKAPDRNGSHALTLPSRPAMVVVTVFSLTSAQSA